MKLRELIKNYRREHSLTLRDFAAQCGMSHSYIAMLEDGKNSKTGQPMIPTLPTLRKIASAMGMSMNELINTADDMPFGIDAGEAQKYDYKDYLKRTAEHLGKEVPKPFIPFPYDASRAGAVLNSFEGHGIFEKEKTPDLKSNASILDMSSIYMIPTFESISAGFGTTAVDEIVDYTPLYITSAAEAAETICVRVSGDSMAPKIDDGDIIQVHKQESVDDGSIAALLLDGDEALVKTVVFIEDGIELRSINPYYPAKRFIGNDANRIRILGLVKKIIKTV